MLPKSLRPGTDLISKEITRQPFVLNIITKAIFNITDEYIPESCEWPNGTRSDVVFVPKSAFFPVPSGDPKKKKKTFNEFSIKETVKRTIVKHCVLLFVRVLKKCI